MKRNVQNTKIEKTSKGITLIALVITIIVLLILAGVAINMAIDSNGLFGKANEAAESWNTAVEEEQTAMQGLLDKLEIDPPGVVSAQGVTLDKTSVTVVIGKTAQLTATVTPNDATNTNVTWSSSDETKVTVDENGLVTGISEGTATITVTTESKNKTATCSVTVTSPVASYITETSTIAGVNKTRNAPIPVGYTASQISTEDTISEGLVIYQGTEPVTGVANSTEHTTAMTTRNQFVWIPVDDVNQMVMCKKNNKEEGSYVENGETITTKICKLELVKNEETNKEELVCKTHNDSTDLCGRLYGTDGTTTDTSTPKTYTTSMSFADRTQKWDTKGYREPDIVSYYDKDDTASTTYMATAGIASGKVADFQAQLTNDFTAMATSVAKYGGFYVARYEAGENGASLKNQKVLVAGTSTTKGHDANTFVNGNMWYGMYNTLRTSSAINKTAVSSHMIWGSQTDMIIKFLEENSLNEPQVGHTARQLATQELTGETTTDIMSNIYDLEGNNLEWTAQSINTTYRAGRGNNFGRVASISEFDPASDRRDNNPGGRSCGVGSRSALYL